jgi:hypothetical protein
MSELNPPADFNALFEKYKPSPRDFVLAQIAAKVEIIEIMLVDKFSQNATQKMQVSDRNVSDALELTEGFLKLLTGKDDAGELGESSENN